MTELENLMNGKSFEDYVRELADKPLAEIQTAIAGFTALEGKTTDAIEKGKVTDTRIALEKAYRAKEAIANKLENQVKEAESKKKEIKRELDNIAVEAKKYMYFLGMNPGDKVFGGYTYTAKNQASFDTASNKIIRDKVATNPQTKEYYNTKYLACIAAYDEYQNTLQGLDKARLENNTKLNIIKNGGHIDGLADFMLNSDPVLPKERQEEVIDETKQVRTELDSLMTKYGLIASGVNSYEDIAKMGPDKLQTFVNQLSDFKKAVSKLDRSIGAKGATEAFYDLGMQVKKLGDSARHDYDTANTILFMKNKDISDLNDKIKENNDKIQSEQDEMALKQIEALKYKYYLGYVTREEVELFNKDYVNKEKARTGANRVNNPINMSSADANKAKASTDPAMRTKFETSLANEESHIQQHANNIAALTEENKTLNATIDALNNGELTPKYQTMVDKYGKELYGMAFVTGTPVKGLDQNLDNDQGLKPIIPDGDPDLDPNQPQGPDPINPDNDPDLNPVNPDGSDPINPDGDPDLDPIDPDAPTNDTDLNPAEPENKEPENKDGKGKKPKTEKKQNPKVIKGLKIAGIVLGIAALGALTGGIAYFALNGVSLSAAVMASPTLAGLTTGSIATLGVEHLGGKSK